MDKTKKYSRQLRNKVSNNQGRLFENLIDQACRHYRNNGDATIEKTPEPFRVKKKNNDGTFTGWFTGLAQPDYKGTLKGGQAIAFEAKMTGSDRIKKSVVTEHQAACLSLHAEMGAKVGVCCMIRKTVGFIPWDVWSKMKEIYGRQYLSEDELKEFEVPIFGYIDFLQLTKVR